MDKRFWGFLIVIVLILGGIFFISNSHKSSDSSTSSTAASSTLTNHVEGSSPLGIKLIEYGDYECPACAEYYDAVNQVAAKYSTTVVVQFRNFPLYQIHPNAIAGARAAEAADLQGKFWQMHDRLYTESILNLTATEEGKTYNAWSTASDPQPYFDAYAKDLGLNVTKFDQDYKSTLVNNRVQADLAYGNKLGIDSTPTFYLDGKKISNPNPATLDSFSKILNAEIVAKGGTPPADTTSTTTTAAQ
jgi:protein-disulfide isomerase